MTDRYGNKIEIGDKIKAPVIGKTKNHLLECNDGFTIDLSCSVTVRKYKGLLYAGQISLASYSNRIVEKCVGK